jgi:coiled-coil domain-containing protein 12
VQPLDGFDREVSVMAEEGSSGKRRVVKFRNYTPQGDDLKESATVAKAAPLDALNRADEVARAALEKSHEAPAVRKPDWDLKKDIQDKIDILDAQTHDSILKLLKMKAAQA